MERNEARKILLDQERQKDRQTDRQADIHNTSIHQKLKMGSSLPH